MTGCGETSERQAAQAHAVIAVIAVTVGVLEIALGVLHALMMGVWHGKSSVLHESRHRRGEG